MTSSGSLAVALVRDRGWAAHLAVHEVFDRYLEALFAHDGLERLVLAMCLRHELTRHMRFEERVVLPRCQDLSVAENVRRDHRLIRLACDRLEELAVLRHFGRVDERLVRHAIVHLDRALDHHDDRETDALYAPLARELDAAGRADLLEGLAAVPLHEPPERRTLAPIVRHPTVAALVSRYAAWLEGRSLDDLPPDASLPEACRAALPKLVARDDQVVRREASFASSPPRARATREMLVEISLRSTLRFVLDALVAAR